MIAHSNYFPGVRLIARFPLIAAVVSDDGATLSLRMATHGSDRW